MFGVVLKGDQPFAVTLERPWANNARHISCIPQGIYVCKRVQSPKFGNTWQVMNVPGRSEILIHAGNRFLDSHGCILIAEKFAVWSDGTTSIADSHMGLKELMSLTEKESKFNLIIREVF